MMKRTKIYLGTVLLVTVLLLFQFSSCGGSEDIGTATMRVVKGTFEIIIPGFGELQAVQSTPISVPTQLRSSQTISWMMPENAIVKKGETVTKLDSNTYKERIQKENYNILKLDLEILEKKRQLKKEKSELLGQLNLTSIEKDMADIYAARDETIHPRNKIIEDSINLDYLKQKTKHYDRKKKQLEKKARAELQLLELRRRTYQVKVDQYKKALESLDIKAPHDGLFIYHKNWRGEKPRIGQAIWAGRKIGKLPDLSKMEAKVYILESEAAGLKEKLAVTITLDSKPDQTFSGKVKSIDTIAKPLERDSPLKYFEVKVSLEKTDRLIMKPGNQVKASVFVQKIADVISIPNQALFFEREKGKEMAYVYLQESSGYKKHEVKIGVRSLTRTVITRGLKESNRILLGQKKET